MKAHLNQVFVQILKHMSGNAIYPKAGAHQMAFNLARINTSLRKNYFNAFGTKSFYRCLQTSSIQLFSLKEILISSLHLPRQKHAVVPEPSLLVRTKSNAVEFLSNGCHADMFYIPHSSQFYILLTCSIPVVSMFILNQSRKQCGSGSDGFVRSQLIWIYGDLKKNTNTNPGSAGQGPMSRIYRKLEFVIAKLVM